MIIWQDFKFQLMTIQKNGNNITNNNISSNNNSINNYNNNNNSNNSINNGRISSNLPFDVVHNKYHVAKKGCFYFNVYCRPDSRTVSEIIENELSTNKIIQNCKGLGEVIDLFNEPGTPLSKPRPTTVLHNIKNGGGVSNDSSNNNNTNSNNTNTNVDHNDDDNNNINNNNNIVVDQKFADQLSLVINSINENTNNMSLNNHIRDKYPTVTIGKNGDITLKFGKTAPVDNSNNNSNNNNYMSEIDNNASYNNNNNTVSNSGSNSSINKSNSITNEYGNVNNIKNNTDYGGIYLDNDPTLRMGEDGILIVD